MTTRIEAAGPAHSGAEAGWSRADTVAVLAIAFVAFSAFALLGVLAHPFIIPGGEWDGYVVRAKDIFSGGSGYDPCHPYGLPLLLAGLQYLGLDPFVAGRLVSAAAGAALAAATFGLLRPSTPRSVAVVGALTVASSGLVFTNATLASSDMPAAGAIGLALWCWVVVARSAVPRFGLVALGGVFAGAAASFRFPGAFPAVGVATIFFVGPWVARGKSVAAVGLGFLLGLSPHLWASFRATGSFLGNENWRNLVLKYQHGFDLRAAFLDSGEAAAHLARHWPEWIVAGLKDAGELFTRGLATVFVRSPGFGLAVGISLLLTAILFVASFGRDRGLRLLAVAGLGCGFATAMTFAADGRFLLPMLPILTVVVLTLAGRWLSSSRALLATGLLGLAAVAWQAPAALERFGKEHGQAEVSAVKALAAQHDELCNVQMIVMVDPFSVSAYVTVQPRLTDEGKRSSRELWDHVARTAKTMATEYVVIARQSAPDLVRGLLEGTPPTGYEVMRSDDVLIVRCPPPPLAWLKEATVVENGASIELTLEVDAPADDVLFGYFFVRDGRHDWYPLDLQPDADRAGRYTRRMAAEAFPRGELLFVPAIIRRNTAFHHGRAIPVRID